MKTSTKLILGGGALVAGFLLWRAFRGDSRPAAVVAGDAHLPILKVRSYR